jgi:hypothetical protein
MEYITYDFLQSEHFLAFLGQLHVTDGNLPALIAFSDFDS